ncbi:hypothetical protein DENIS_4051 [Desulfonema ishimotonii]|uniref:Uncharacterized protein n=1 Tax=Desulfonema ishimotonii TaxID=45657 RepID=A0A401G1G8_9BACT|nr:hypothetical protein [Desulfonema ishimotonii]GBC63062.1 hypothetical protein DENIS_4051 [Desulfonema ishimotonii]
MSNSRMSIVASILSIVIGIIGIILYFIDINRPDLKIVILSNEPAFEINNKIEKLKILFNGQDLLRDNKSLSLVTFKLGNWGNRAIKPEDFDKDQLPFISVSNGNIFECLIDSSENYLKRKLEEMSLSSKGEREILKIEIPPLIINPKQFVIMQLLVTHNKNQRPRLDAYGNIANIGNIKKCIIHESNIVSQNSVITGDLKTQFLRFAFYGFLLIILTFIIYRILDKIWPKKSSKNNPDSDGENRDDPF